MKKALIVGIDYYTHVSSLYGCVSDAKAVKHVLERHADGSINFAVNMLCSTGPGQNVCRNQLSNALYELFSSEVETALFYFSGRGYVDDLSGYLITSECSVSDDGLYLYEILALANRSPAINKIVILDSCHAGAAAYSIKNRKIRAKISEGVSFLSASTADQYALEANNSGLFTSTLINALNGDAADLLGNVTLNSAYANIERSFRLWEQTPVFKNNITHLVPLRTARPAIAIGELLKICELFPEPEHEIPLDTGFLPHQKGRSKRWHAPDPDKAEIYRILLKYAQLNLVTTLNSPCIMSAAIEGTRCKLTPLGEHYRMLVIKKLI